MRAIFKLILNNWKLWFHCFTKLCKWLVNSVKAIINYLNHPSIYEHLAETDIHVQKWLNNFCQLAFYIFHYRKIFLFLHVVYQNVTCFEFYTRSDFYVPFHKINKEFISAHQRNVILLQKSTAVEFFKHCIWMQCYWCIEGLYCKKIVRSCVKLAMSAKHAVFSQHGECQVDVICNPYINT